MTMWRLIWLGMFAGFLSLLQMAVVGPLLGTEGPVIIPLAWILFLVANFRMRDALLTAIVTGVFFDSISSLPMGVMTVAFVFLTYACDYLYRHFITSHTGTAIFGFHAVSYLTWVAILVVIRLVRATLLGWSLPSIESWAEYLPLAYGLALQPILGLIFITIHEFAVTRLFRGKVYSENRYG